MPPKNSRAEPTKLQSRVDCLHAATEVAGQISVGLVVAGSDTLAVLVNVVPYLRWGMYLVKLHTEKSFGVFRLYHSYVLRRTSTYDSVCVGCSPCEPSLISLKTESPFICLHVYWFTFAYLRPKPTAIAMLHVIGTLEHNSIAQ